MPEGEPPLSVVIAQVDPYICQLWLDGKWAEGVSRIELVFIPDSFAVARVTRFDEPPCSYAVKEASVELGPFKVVSSENDCRIESGGEILGGIVRLEIDCEAPKIPTLKFTVEPPNA